MTTDIRIWGDSWPSSKKHDDFVIYGTD